MKLNIAAAIGCVASLLTLSLAACGDPAPSAAPEAAASPTARLDERLEAAGATATARAGEPRFNGEILGIYIAPSIDDWSADLRDEHERTVAGGCVGAPTGQSELDFMSALSLPAGFERTGGERHVTPTSNPEVIACGGKTTSVTLEFGRPHEAGPAMVTLTRTTTRAVDFEAAESDVSARTIGARQAVVIAPTVGGAPGQRSMVIWPEDFGMTAVHAFNTPESDLMAFAEAVAAASAPYWERRPAGLAGEVIRVCAEIPAGATNDHAAFGLTDNGHTTHASFSFFEATSNTSYVLLLYAGDALDDCPDHVRKALEFGNDRSLYEAARGWLKAHGGELTGECRTRPVIPGRNEVLIDWCYYRPRFESASDIVLTIERGVGFTVPLVLRARDGRYDVVSAEQEESDELRMWYFHDDNSMRWTRYAGADSYRLTATLHAGREHAPDPCAEPPLEEDTRAIVLNETFGADVDGYALELPRLPPEDAWWVAIAGTGNDGMIHLYALDEDGNVIAETGTTWVRDTFCVKPTREAAHGG